MPTTSPTSPTFSTPVAPASFPSQITPGATVTLDLRTKFGAWLHCSIGRASSASALTNPGYIAIRRQNNDSNILPNKSYDFVSSTLAVNSTTVSAGGGAGSTTVALAAGAGFTSGQVVLLHSSGARVEFVAIMHALTSTMYLDRSQGFRTGHNTSDIVANGADVGSVWIPGGDIWEITPVNNSGQTLVMAVEAAVYDSDTTTA